ncbi:Protein AroA(G) [Thermoflexales bacterium]|nr:Protein AroA(G) [Thermoflexales bacterium]
MNEFNERIDLLRRQIDEIDLQLLYLINSRSKLVLKIQGIKRKQGMSVYAPERKRDIQQA